MSLPTAARSVQARTLMFLWLAQFLSRCQALPTILVDSAKPHCFNVEAAQDTVIRVLYQAPDIILDKHAEHYSPTHLSIDVRPALRVTDSKLHTAPILNRLKPTHSLLDATEGSVEHSFEVDGKASVCIKAGGATREKPMRFGLGVETKRRNAIAKLAETTSDVDKHLSHMEIELQRIGDEMKTILKEADFSKERDAIFHQQTQSMHSAAIFWPIVKVCVLLMTGFTQASHIVRFFQSRRII
ncbi:transmembrane emp24 domain-containing protein 4 [Mayamaea pseudoterrestris]|nr:transmembrane emp24 domain-containing protein 4 [Mayamaea pseudoterrestris]